MLWIVKIGGSIISTADEQNQFNEPTLKLIASSLRALEHSLIIVHGTGYMSKEFARHNQILHGKIEARKKQTVTQCLLMLRNIHFTVLRIFVKAGIPAISISPFAFCELRQGQIKILHAELLRTVLRRGFVPILHGDLIVNPRGDFTVCSSDALIAALARQFPADRLLFATDVAGVFRKDPKQFPGSECFECLSPNTLKRLAQLPNDRNDVSGAMPAKLKAIQQVTNYFHHCYIFDGRLPESWHTLIHLKKRAGTLILGNTKAVDERKAKN